MRRTGWRIRGGLFGMNAEEMKRAAAARAAELVRDGMRQPLGTRTPARQIGPSLGETQRPALKVV